MGYKKTKIDPKHVAVILDGNGRWAKKKGLPRTAGHRAGGENLNHIIESFLKIKIPFISLYVFSTENWKRSSLEIKSLWKLLEEFLEHYQERFHQLGICCQVSGDITKLSQGSYEQIQQLIQKTSHNKKLMVNFCINYGSQQEILRACNHLIQVRLDLLKNGKEKRAKASLTQKEFESHLYTSYFPPVDLLVRTGGEMRISNFLLWQCAYAEFYITEKLWPDFDGKELSTAISWYHKRERRYGGL